MLRNKIICNQFIMYHWEDFFIWILTLYMLMNKISIFFKFDIKLPISFVNSNQTEDKFCIIANLCRDIEGMK